MFPFTREKALEEAIGKLGVDLTALAICCQLCPESSAFLATSLEVGLRVRGIFRIRARPGTGRRKTRDELRAPERRKRRK